MMRSDFAIFIMVHGRPNKMWTYQTLRKCGYTGEVFFVADDLDEKLQGYIDKYGDKLLVFNKMEVAKLMDAGDNSGDLRSTLFAANTIFELAKEKGMKYFMIMCDDYTDIEYSFNSKLEFKSSVVTNLDDVINGLIKFYAGTPTLTIAFAQGGDFIGGKDGGLAEPKLIRKAMNTFLCSTERQFKFMGRLNEDVTTYVNLGNKGKLFFTTTMIKVIQKGHQQEKGGLTEMYLDYGTYVKSFFSVMYNPASVKVSELGTRHKRIHHKISWNKCAPKILRE